MEETNVEQAQPEKRHKFPLVILTLTTVFLLGFITSQDPSKGGPMLILLFLSTVFVWLLTATWLLIRLVTTQFAGRSFSPVRQLYTSVAVASGLVFLIGLQTLHQLQLADVVLLVVFELLLNFYLLRRF